MKQHDQFSEDLEPASASGPVIRPFASPVRGPEAFRSARAPMGRVQAGLSAAAASLGVVGIAGGPIPEVTPIGVSRPVPHSPGPVQPAEAERSTSEVLGDTIRRWARPTTVEELKSRGVHKVRSISMSRVGALLEKAVNRALIERTLESDTDEALTLSTTAREQFVRLTHAEATGTKPADLTEGKPLHERATSTLDRLRRELEDRRRVLADREKQLSDGDLDQAEDQKLSNTMRELFAEHAGIDDRLLEREVLDLVLGELRTSRRRARMARLEEHQREIGTLERRITKLSLLLGETEDALRRIREGKKVDPGVSSIYDEVQGLGLEDEHFTQKSELMRSLFEANLALRR